MCGCRAVAAASTRLAQDDAHGVEQVYRYPDPAGGSHALATQAEHSPQLKGDQRGRHDFPGMVHTLNRQAKAPGQSAHAFPRKKPEVLRRGHKPPSRAREPRDRRAKSPVVMTMMPPALR